MKYLTLTSELVEQAVANFRNQLTNSYANADKVDISIPTKLTLAKEQRPSIIVTTLADAKMKKLIAMCDKEVAWHGTVSYEAETNTYTIEDILVFPQEVTGGTATATDDYGPWTMELDDDTFNKMRFHGHSHVNMGVFPSSVDLNYQQTLVDKITDYYIFAIYNKRGEYVLWIYDVANNVCYDKTDIDYVVTLDTVTKWATAEVRDKVKDRAPTVVTNYATTPVGSMVGKDRQYITSNEWVQDGVHVYRSWMSGHVYSTVFGGYVKGEELKAYEDLLNKAKDVTDKKNKKKDKPQTRRGRSAYDQFVQEKIKKNEEAKAAKQMMFNDNICNGKCATCENPCAYQYS